MSGKKYRESRSRVERRPYELAEAIGLMQEIRFAGFDETAEISIRLGVDPKHADQMVRGTVVLPHGLGKSVSVCVITSSEKVKEAEEAGAEFVFSFDGGDVALLESDEPGEVDKKPRAKKKG